MMSPTDQSKIFLGSYMRADIELLEGFLSENITELGGIGG